MLDLTIHPEYEDLIKSIQELENQLSILVEKRDTLLFTICPNLQTEYMLKIGKIEYSIFEFQCKILRLKRKIEMIQSFLNKDLQYNIKSIDEQLDFEYKEYTEKLIQKQKEIEEARIKKSNRGRLLTVEEAEELRKLYLEIVKKLHPDINPELTEEQHGHYIDAVNAYKNGDLSEIRIIFMLLERTSVNKKYKEDTLEKLKERKKSLLIESEHLMSEIDKIKESYPYNIKELICNKDKIKYVVDELTKKLTDCSDQYNKLESRIKEMLKDE